MYFNDNTTAVGSKLQIKDVVLSPIKKTQVVDSEDNFQQGGPLFDASCMVHTIFIHFELVVLSTLLIQRMCACVYIYIYVCVHTHTLYTHIYIK